MCTGYQLISRGQNPGKGYRNFHPVPLDMRHSASMKYTEYVIYDKCWINSSVSDYLDKLCGLL